VRSSIVSSLLLTALLLTGAATGAIGGARAQPHPSGLGLALTADPTSGSAPLVVGFLASLSPATTLGSFRWSFGDGSYYNTSSTGSSSPAHSYAAAGVYQANVSVTSSAGDANASLAIDVVVENLVVAIEASPTNGTAPLTVHFLASISGGTGTYESILWNFGDGDSGSGPDLNYTYPVAGTFQVNLTVADSSGHAVSVQRTIDVLGGPPSSPSAAGPNGLTAAVPYVLAVAGLLAVFAIGAASYRAAVRRRAEAIEAPPGAASGGVGATAPPEIPSTAGAGGTAASRAPSGPSGPGAALDDSRRLSERLLIHLLWYGRPGAEGIARAEASQQGMARALGSGQNTISKALSRLRDAGAVRVELQHVPGAPRRVKTYSLTPRGEAVARSLTRGPGDTRLGPRPPP
jgi:PKD repeat protein/DNA-binding transcriptional ArsR family regulator